MNIYTEEKDREIILKRKGVLSDIIICRINTETKDLYVPIKRGVTKNGYLKVEKDYIEKIKIEFDQYIDHVPAYPLKIYTTRINYKIDRSNQVY